MANRDFSNVPAGPGAIEVTGESPKPLLEGATDYEIVEVHNPLNVDFTGLVGITRPVNVPFEVRTDGVTGVSTQNESDVSRNYGITLKNPAYQAKGHIQQRITIKAGATIRLQGAQAQVVVRQLVTEIMARQGNQLLLADAYARNQIEKQILSPRRSIQDIMDTPLDIPTQMSNALDKLNKEDNDKEQAFGGRTAQSDDSGEGSPTPDAEPVNPGQADKSKQTARRAS